MHFYAALTGPLRGYYLELPLEIDSTVKGRAAMRTSALKDLWCDIYSAAEVDELIDTHGGARIPILQGVLEYDYHSVEELDYSLL